MTNFLRHCLFVSLVPSLVAGGVAGCGTEDIPLGATYQPACLQPALPSKDIDLLFVVDNSGSMRDSTQEVASLVQSKLVDVVAAAIGQPPNLHVGVVTSDMGCGYATARPFGDDGQLQTRPECGITDGASYLSSIDGTTNFDGYLGDALACIAEVGEQGCGMEAPLAAAAKAVDPATNPGFLREGALLVVVILTDEDDCSAGSQNLFGPDRPDNPLSSYRCFSQGVVCDEEPGLGTKTNCRANTDVGDVQLLDLPYSQLVAAKGGDPTKVFVATITGGISPIEVVIAGPTGERPGDPTLAPSCTKVSGDVEATAFPAVRLHHFASMFPARSWEESICGDNLIDPMERTGNALSNLAGRNGCLLGTFADRSSEQPGVQPLCRAYLVSGTETEAEVRSEIPQCSGSNGPCFDLVPDSSCSFGGPGVSATLTADPQTLAGRDLVVECLSVPQ